ncbi:hypothetical protein SAMN04488104_104716 [Algoriphagus faecimaris]|uniref:AtuA-like ferredoxin-fold domain-containing protein n=1 Tax=Algoriphagus faecimaris TaxID=686796 RepID=A0A1G6WUL7_9BACT|nr:hypothetical protein [Algoriphagus faecimaris]SDD68756.1 hypothetical protein SAMN04488104_104716 [Algoriphagus faecimaris]
MLLREIAHARTGDKGNISNISLIVFDQAQYELIRKSITADRVKEWLGKIVKGEVHRYELPQLGAFNFVLYDALDGGVTSSLQLDKHRKTLSSYLLEMPIG